jgi:hypothetical protein
VNYIKLCGKLRKMKEKFIFALQQRNVIKTSQVGTVVTLVTRYSEGFGSNLGRNT